MKNKNINILLEKVLSNEEMCQKFAEMDSLEDIYDFCVSIQDGYSKEEFAEYFDELLSMLPEEYYAKVSSATKLSDDEIENVAGGTKGDVKRFIAASLAALTTMSIPMNSVFAANTQDESTQIIEQIEKNSDKESQGTLAGMKAKLGFAKDFVARNKRKITLGAILLFAIILGIYNKDEIKKKWDNLDWVKDRNFIKETEDKIKEKKTEIKKAIVDKKSKMKLENELKKLESDLKTYKNMGSSHWYDSIPGLGKAIAEAGVAVGGVKTIWDVFSKGLGVIGGLSQNISRVEHANWAIKNIMSELEYKAQLMSEKMSKEEYNKETGEKILELGLQTVKGQENAKNEVRKFFHKVTMEKARLKSTGEKDSHAYITVFNGASGTGKSFTAGHLARAISNVEPYVMSASEVDVNNSKSSIVGQLFGDNTSSGYYGYGNSGGQEQRKSFVRYLQDHPNDGVVIMNEYDKMCLRDAKDHPLDETMRTLMDEGVIRVNGQTIDCSGLVFILTTNESDGSLKGEVKVDPITGKLVDPTQDDNTGSRTIVKHDKSFLNRLHIISFDNLSAKDYTDIAKDKFAPTIEFLRTDEGGNLDVKIDDESYNKIGKYAEIINEGARTVDKILGGLFMAISEKVYSLKESGQEYKGKTFELIYDDVNNTFTVK